MDTYIETRRIRPHPFNRSRWQIWSYPGASALHGEADTHSEYMDDLAAAAAVFAMEVDSEAEDDMAQEVDAGERQVSAR